MKTFRIVLFVQRGHDLSDFVEGELQIARAWVCDDQSCVAVLDRQYHNAAALGAAIEHYPTLLVLDETGEELFRETDAQRMCRYWCKGLLDQVLSHNQHASRV